MRIDFDTIEAETTGEPHVISWRGHDFTIPPEIPLETCDLVLDLIESDSANGVDAYKAARAIVEGTLGVDQWQTFLSLRPSMGQLVRFQTQIITCYGFDDAGESSASDGSSTRTSNRSRPTSKGSTASTSAPIRDDAASVA